MLLGGTVAEERSQRGTVPPCPQAGRELRIEIRKSSTVPPTMSTGKRCKEMKLLGGKFKPSHTMSKLPETSQSGTPRNGTVRMCVTTSKSENIHTRTDLPKLENACNISKPRKVSTKIDKISSGKQRKVKLTRTRPTD